MKSQQENLHTKDNRRMAKTVKKTAESLGKTLWKTANRLRKNMDATEYKHVGETGWLPPRLSGGGGNPSSPTWKVSWHTPYLMTASWLPMNVTEGQLIKYLEIFHKSLEETAKQFLPEDQFSNLLHLSLLPAKITGYVSTQYGIAIEYRMSEKTIYEIIKGSARVEDLFFNAPIKIRETGPLIFASGAYLTFKDLTLEGVFPLRLSSIEASVRISKVRCFAEGWERII